MDYEFSALGQNGDGNLLPVAESASRGHGENETQRLDAAAAPSSGGQTRRVAQFSAAAQNDLVDQTRRVAQSSTVDEIVQLTRLRRRWQKAEKSLILQGKAFCRSWSSGDKEVGSKLFDAVAKGEDADIAVKMALDPYLSAIARFKAERKQLEKTLLAKAKSLPTAAWVAEQTGFGMLNFALIVGEAGDLSNYDNPAKLWKRMGLAVINGGRQRLVAGDAALEHGYNPERRAVAWNLGGTLVKVGDRNPWRQLYLDRKAYLAARSPEMTPGHINNSAMRYMTKRALRDLWAAWRRTTATPRVEPSVALPSSTPLPTSPKTIKAAVPNKRMSDTA
jgi:hypothetical protein